MQIKRMVQIITGIILLILAGSCSAIVLSRCDWNFIISVGGIKTEDPFLTDDGWYLPVKCDISGLNPITNDPTTVNSALACSRIKYTKNDTAIFVTVYKGLISKSDNDCRCRAVNIGKLNSASYNVYYKYNDETHLIGMFDIATILKDY